MAASSALGIASYSINTSRSFTILPSKHTLRNSPFKSASLRNSLNGLSLSLWRKEGFRIDAIVKRSPKRMKYSTSRPLKGDGVLYLKVDPSGADSWRLEPVIELIKNGAVGVIPTDTVYAIVCDLKNRSAVEHIHRIKNMDAKKPLCILCRSFRDIDTYTTGFPRGNSEGQANVFRAARQCLPGPYTFILPASKEMPKECTKFGSAKAKYASRKSVGVRMPDDPICQAILEKLDGPLLCSSVRWPIDDGWMIDPATIADIYGSTMGREGVGFVVDGGIRVADPSTVIDMTGNEPLLLRQGKGVLYDWMLPKANDSAGVASKRAISNPYAA